MLGRYSRLMDARDASLVRWVCDEAGVDALFVVQEKVRGCAVGLGCDGCWVSLEVGEGEQLGCWLEEWVERYRPRLFGLYARIRQLFPGVRKVIVLGELFGGEYPHRAVAHYKGSVPVRKGVCYAPDYGFYAFDIVVEENVGGGSPPRYLSLSVCNRLFESLGFFHARTLFQGRLEECLRYPNCFPTHLPDWLDLPPIRNNWCAGTVIRPVTPLYAPNGERVLLKNNNSRHLSEPPSSGPSTTISPPMQNVPTGVQSRVGADGFPISLECADMLAELRALFNPDLLCRVRKELARTPSLQQDLRVSGHLRREVLEQFFQLNLNRFDALPARERQYITRTLCHLSDRLARDALKQEE